MNSQLRCNFRKEELELAALIGSGDGTPTEKVTSLFVQLDDPLLSEKDVEQLLSGVSTADVRSALAKLVADVILEVSTQTQRPFDPDGIMLYRKAGTAPERLRLIAVEADLGNEERRFQFTCEARLIRSIARIDRLDSLAGTGNQRGEIEKHVAEIAQGISNGTQIPNSVLLVLQEDRVVEPEAEDEAPESFIRIKPLSEFTTVPIPHQANMMAQRFRTVELDFPFRRAAFDEEKSAVLVDGQQRTAALALVDVDKVKAFQISVNANVGDADAAKRVFMIANSTQKIETQFSRALLASMDDQSVGYLQKERARALAAKALALDDPSSPFKGLIQYPGVKNDKRPPIAYNSLFQVVSTFANSSVDFGENPERLASVVKRSYELVKKVWPVAWGQKPKDSRLMHGAGLRAMAFLLANKLEQLFSNHGDLDSPELWSDLEASLTRLRTRVVWSLIETQDSTEKAKTNYTKEVSTRQNTNNDIAELANFLKKESLQLDTNARARKS
ncbi:DGQHR domain-containing protein [Hyalangium rubrum]|uniref:DGQHR domain-containing protein n=1 Tax=Hyalangium rubrum TaxID=3103134 RepID=A0ABU5HFF0_9BACT|nr:DGQHR domain-containing protein [Hyalangium sp. s54d21]MDY7231538.1 DGQHR domain-containing protein [Hyalangium sp. s54d21]